ncbi:Tbingi protein [Perkinsela sp. CCAP 1560/4]|nr:Tbingi protein [Perkinsela sp. CCAP 1560/4]|eukprot:KNH04515.1 Tbingi protein [Perkinsela sp. CCAP 1560/4]
MRAVREFNLSSLLLRAGDVHPNPGPTLRIAQFNILGFTPGKRLSLLHKAITHDLDVILLQELHIVENEASRLTLDGYQCFAIARDAKGGGVAVLIRKGFQCSLTSQSVSEVIEQATVCVKVGAHLCQFTSAYFPRGNKVTSAAVHSLSQADWTTHVICADANCHHANWDKHVAPNPGGSHIVDFCIDEGYTLLNTGDPTRRSLTIERGQLSAPDVTLARGCTTQRWQATPDPDSDHFLITFNFVVGDDEPLAHHVPKPSYYSWGQANWQEYSRLVSEDCKRFPTKGTPNQQAKFLSRSIAKATAKAVPKGVTRVRHLWSADLEDAERKCEKLLSPIDGTTPSQRREILFSTRERKRLLSNHCKQE